MVENFHMTDTARLVKLMGELAQHDFCAASVVPPADISKLMAERDRLILRLEAAEGLADVHLEGDEVPYGEWSERHDARLAAYRKLKEGLA